MGDHHVKKSFPFPAGNFTVILLDIHQVAWLENKKDTQSENFPFPLIHCPVECVVGVTIMGWVVLYCMTCRTLPHSLYSASIATTTLR